jgi:hypothetical protein
LKNLVRWSTCTMSGRGDFFLSMVLIYACINDRVCLMSRIFGQEGTCFCKAEKKGKPGKCCISPIY